MGSVSFIIECRVIAGSQTENGIQLLQRTASLQHSHTQTSPLSFPHTQKLLSLVKSTLSISLALLAVTSAAPQGLAYCSGSDLSYGDGGTGTLCSGPDCWPTQVPVSPITIAPETDFLPINNV
ncbi:hypothetical protein KI688_010806 [Linnemannia hyalina]|uniref:Uncharacterized protein n=1 Tax=Linnemannia hyalina TaxID=64524 RepID=A0A9P8BUW6_9FUNG|nr:hypothetical protein KI688_010806 [Linnemannia hyalina]